MKDYIQDCTCMESEPFINDDKTPYCRWCGINFKTMFKKGCFINTKVYQK